MTVTRGTDAQRTKVHEARYCVDTNSRLTFTKLVAFVMLTALTWQWLQVGPLDRQYSRLHSRPTACEGNLCPQAVRTHAFEVNCNGSAVLQDAH